MSDDDLIRRGDARGVWKRWNWPRTDADRDMDVDAALCALPAAPCPVKDAAVRLAEAALDVDRHREGIGDKSQDQSWCDEEARLDGVYVCALDAYRAAKGDA